MSQPHSDMSALLDAIVTEYDALGRVNAGSWVRGLPQQQAEFIVDFIAELELQGGVTTETLPEWSDVGGVVARTLNEFNSLVSDTAKIGVEIRAARTLPKATSDSRNQFRRAAVYAWAFDVMRRGHQAATVYSVGKAVYLLEHALNLGLFDTHKQMAYGPYDPKLKYGGAQKIARTKKWFASSSDESIITAGEQLDEAASFAIRYVKDDRAARRLLVFLSGLGFEDLELLSTVHWASRALQQQQLQVSVPSVLQWLGANWPSKIERRHFDHATVELTLIKLGQLGFIESAT